MLRSVSAAATLVDRLCRPQRIGVFGHRGVGKSTLLTMLYREAVGGRLPGLRLAAADARTADYLSDKVLQLESGQPLPGTLAETDLRFHLYHEDRRLELLVKDYQGEHVELGRQGTVREFLRDCDAVLLCLDLTTVPSPAERLRRQQEIEQLIEDYLADEPRRQMDRPAALVLTKADLLGPQSNDIDALARLHCGMTRHTLESHCPNTALFAVSSLGDTPLTPGESGTGPLQPRNLADPLVWLAKALQAQDEARLKHLWTLAGGRRALLERGIACFAQRYPDAPATKANEQQLRELRRHQRRRRMLGLAAAIAIALVGMWTYDAVGQRDLNRFEAEHADNPQAQIEQWQQYQAWHPTRHLFGSLTAEDEKGRLDELAAQLRERDRVSRLSELRRKSADPDADPEASWREFQDFRARFPEANVDGDLDQLRAVIKARRDDQVKQRAQRAYEELARASQRSSDLSGLVMLTDRFLRDHSGSFLEPEVRRIRAGAVRRLDEQEIQAARTYSAQQPLNFHTRRELYQRYLDRHPGGGTFADEARGALKTIDEQWDKHDFRAVRDQYLAHPGDMPELVAQCRRYLAVHPKGKFTGSAAELLRWSERVTAAGEYKVVLRGGDFEHKIARWFSRGTKLSVELEVGGVRYGPSSIVVNRYDPDWDYEFPRRIRWKLGDPVTIRVNDHTWKDRVVVEFASASGDPLAIKMLSGENMCGANRITFESDFAMPTMPKIE
ncbi:MAG: GTPase domain-containing protein [Gemmataceae bacterium]|nr:GTPase domain-containing protein [Gemmataceae bacterium]